MLKLTWLGHACFALEAEGYRILLDPYSPDYVPGLGRVELSAHKVLCSHDHADHGWKEGIPAPLNEIPCPFTIRTMPVFHDDQWGTAVITLSGVINYAYLAGRELSSLKVVINGAGAAGTRICDMLKAAGVKDLTLRLYEGGRHEMFNEVNREEVWAELVAWLDSKL